MSLKPIRWSATLTYKCPHCEAEHTKELREVMVPGQYIFCYCGKNVEIKQIETPKLSANYVETYEPLTYKLDRSKRKK